MFKSVLLFTLIILSSCATLFSNGGDLITFTSEPAGASVYLNGVIIGKTPLSYEVDRSTFKQTEVVVKLEGKESKQFLLGRSLATAAIFNLTSWPSWLTDATSGNMIEYSPRAYFIDLRSVKTSEAEIKRSYYVMINHKRILNDLARGEGEFLETYLDLTNLSAAKKLVFRNEISKNSYKYFTYVWPNEIYAELEQDLRKI